MLLQLHTRYHVLLFDSAADDNDAQQVLLCVTRDDIQFVLLVEPDNLTGAATAVYNELS